MIPPTTTGELDPTWRGTLARWWPVLVLVAGAVWICAAMWSVTWWQSHENGWYPARVVEYREAWAGGAHYPRWCADLYGGYGYPFFDFYAPGVYFVGALIDAATGAGAIDSVKVTVLVYAIAGAVGAYGAMRGETGRTDAALVGGALFTFLPYRATDLFARGDLAEYGAYCLIPLVVWAYRAVARGRVRRPWLVAFGGAAAHAAVLMTHTLMGMFATELVAVMIVAQVVLDRRRAGALVAMAALAIGMAAVYVVPAFVERGLVHLDRITGGRYTPWHNMVPLRALGDPFFTPGLGVGIGAAVWLGSFVVRRTRRAAIRAAPWWLLALAAMFLVLPWSRPLWHVLPFGAEVQFPWRLLGLIGLFAALGTAVLWAGALPARRWTLALAAAVCVPMPLLVTTQRAVVEAAAPPMSPAAIRATGETSTAMDEYLPRTVPDHPPPRRGDVWVDDAAAADDAHRDSTASRPDIVARTNRIDPLHTAIAIDAPRAGDVTLGTLGYPGWSLTTGADGTELVTGHDGLLRVRVARAGHYEVVVGFGTTPLRVAAALVSLISLLAGIPILRMIRACRPPLPV